MNTNQTESIKQTLDAQWIHDNCEKLKVEYDPSVLLTNSKELELVNYFFDSISCRR